MIMNTLCISIVDSHDIDYGYVWMMNISFLHMKLCCV